jgi:SAM-dependent methyltransferase
MIKKFKGLIYPDEYLIKFFFKEKLNKVKKKVLELGCGSGNNLNLFYQHNWDITGVDNNSKNISDAKINFKYIKKKLILNNNFNFFKEDMLLYLKKIKHLNFDTIIFSNSIYYLEYNKIIKILSIIKERNINKKLIIFFRIRLKGDSRIKISKKIKKNSYLITSNDTNELGCINTFFTEKSFIKLIKSIFKIREKYSLKIKYDNLIKKKIITGNDLVFWFKL